MSWDNNPGGRQEGRPDLSEMIKKAGHELYSRALSDGPCSGLSFTS